MEEFRLATAQPASSFTFDAEADGTDDLGGADLDTWSFSYDAPGLYCPTVAVEFPDGSTDHARSALIVYDPVALDALLRSRWAELKQSLAAGDIAAALDVIALKDRADYAAMFQPLSANQLAAIEELLPDLSPLLSVEAGRAEYEMLRQDSQGATVSHPVTFMFDVDGVWRIEFL